MWAPLTVADRGSQPPRSATQEAEIAKPIASARAALRVDGWDRLYHLGHYQLGRGMTIEDALAEARSGTS